MVDLGGSLAVASMGLFATGVSTDLNGQSLPIPLFSIFFIAYSGFGFLNLATVTYLSGGGKVGDKIQATASCDKSTIASITSTPSLPELTILIWTQWERRSHIRQSFLRMPKENLLRVEATQSMFTLILQVRFALYQTNGMDVVPR